MEALIMSCGTGGGHNSAGRAVAEELQSRGHRVTFLDTYKLAGKKTENLIDNSYVKLVQRSPKTFGLVYALGEAYRRLPVHSPVYWANKKMADCTWNFIRRHHYDIIIMSHMYPAHILTNLKEEHRALPKTVLIATDYTCIPFMEEADCDYYVIPSEELREEFCSKGIPQNRTLPFGIPVRQEFSADCEKAGARKRLGLSDGKTYLLLSGGSIGAGSIEKAITVLQKYLTQDPTCCLICVCGNNQALYQSLQTAYRNHPQVRLVRSTPQMADYMKACDVFITKPGGLSSTEAAAVRTPLIHISPIPGCESRNANYFSTRGMSIYVKNLEKELLPALEQLHREAAVKQMRQAQKRCIDGFAAARLCDFIEQEII